MKEIEPENPMTDDFFRARLDQMIDLRHPLAGRMLWAQIEGALALTVARRNRQGQVACGSDLFGTTLEIAGAGVSAAGRSRLPIRLMAALLYPKHAFNLSDEELVVRCSENVVWQYFSARYGQNEQDIATARKSRLFSDTVAGAKASATVYSLMLTCRACGVEPHAWLLYVLTELPQRAPDADISDLMPFNYAKRLAEASVN
jgi:IS66 C-terminal element/Transposase domain (DUF772)